MGRERFDGTLEKHGSGTIVRLPFDPKQAFGSGRPPVRVTVNGHTFRTTLFTMGGQPLLGLNRDVREAAGIDVGESVVFEIEPDDEPREVAVPTDLAEAFSGAPDARAVYDDLSYTHRKEYVRWIEEAKRPETRTRRIGRAIEMLRENRKTPDRPNES